MHTTFYAIAEKTPGIKWQNVFQRHWPAYKRWYLSRGLAARPTYVTCRKKMRQHMPELVPVYDQLCALSGGGDAEARFLSLYSPPAYISGCSQIVWPAPQLRLIRNYDYNPMLLDGMVLKSRWLGQDVIGVSDCLIGVLDGINEYGLCVSLTFGGSRKMGEGFGIPIILRYILETCINVKQAAKALRRIPIHMAYNVTVVSATGESFTAHLFPGKDAIILKSKVMATNHQPFDDEWSSYARKTATKEREALLQQTLNSPHSTLHSTLHQFHQSPLYSTNYKTGFGTVYTSMYYPQERVLEMLWPDSNWILGFQHFQDGQRTIQYLDSGAMTLNQF